MIEFYDDGPTDEVMKAASLGAENEYEVDDWKDSEERDDTNKE